MKDLPNHSLKWWVSSPPIIVVVYCTLKTRSSLKQVWIQICFVPERLNTPASYQNDCLTLDCFVFVDQWYLSKHGKDTPQCGTLYQNACLTLGYLLTRSYNETHSASMTFITDTNMTFDYRVKVYFNFSLSCTDETFHQSCFNASKDCSLIFPQSFGDFGL